MKILFALITTTTATGLCLRGSTLRLRHWLVRFQAPIQQQQPWDDDHHPKLLVMWGKTIITSRAQPASHPPWRHRRTSSEFNPMTTKTGPNIGVEAPEMKFDTWRTTHWFQQDGRRGYHDTPRTFPWSTSEWRVSRPWPWPLKANSTLQELDLTSNRSTPYQNGPIQSLPSKEN